MKSHYFDYNATTPVAPEVVQAMEPYFKEHFANPSSLHHLARIPLRAIRDARRNVAALLGAADENEIVFTSCGSESNNAAIRAALVLSGRREVITSTVEHSSIRKLCSQLLKEKIIVHEVPVDSDGNLRIDALKECLSERTAVVTLMLANNETGALFPIDTIAPLVKERGALLHIDAVQAVGKHPFDLAHSQIDFLSLSGHKFYAPKGIGALYIKNKTGFHPLLHGGSQERGRRAGTENVPYIAGIGRAAELAMKDLNEEIRRLSILRSYFEGEVIRQVPGVGINGERAHRLVTTSNLRFKGIDGEAMLIALDLRGMCASSGSACMSGSHEPSHVLKAMGLTDEEANSSLRFSFGRYTREEEIDALVGAIIEVAALLRAAGTSGAAQQAVAKQ